VPIWQLFVDNFILMHFEGENKRAKDSKNRIISKILNIDSE
jgi:hypothetical protein